MRYDDTYSYFAQSADYFGGQSCKGRKKTFELYLHFKEEDMSLKYYSVTDAYNKYEVMLFSATFLEHKKCLFEFK